MPKIILNGIEYGGGSSGGSSSEAIEINYNNSASQLISTNVQNAIDELNTDKAATEHTHTVTDITDLPQNVADAINTYIQNPDNNVVTLKDIYIKNVNTYISLGYSKTAKDYTINLPSEVIGNSSQWGVILFVPENLEQGTGTQIYYPIDGDYKGRIFTRSVCNIKLGGNKVVISPWTMLATTSEIPTIPSSLPASDVPEWAKNPNKPTYTASEVGALPSDGKAVDSDKLNGHPASDYATTDTVTALADDVDRHAFGEQSGGKNIWNEKVSIGWINDNGNNDNANDAIRSADYISVKPNSACYFVSQYRSYDNRVYICFYTSDKGFLSKSRLDNIHSGNDYGKGIIDVPSNCHYIMFYIRNLSPAVYNHDIAIIEGTSGQYEPYIASNAQLTESISKTNADLSEIGANNVFDGDLGVGYIYLGVFYPSNQGYSSSSPISVNSGDKVKIKSDIESPNGIRVAFYNQNMEFISELTSAIGVKEYYVTAPSNAKFFKFCLRDMASTYNPSVAVYVNSIQNMISDEWDSTRTYVFGSYVIYQNRLWKCLVQNVGQNPTEGTYWQSVSVASEFMPKNVKRITSLEELFGYSGIFTCIDGVTFGSYTLGKYSSGVSIFFGDNDGTLIATNWSDRKVYTAICGSRSWTGYRTV